jgi:hypothetical protein
MHCKKRSAVKAVFNRRPTVSTGTQTRLGYFAKRLRFCLLVSDNAPARIARVARYHGSASIYLRAYSVAFVKRARQCAFPLLALPQWGNRAMAAFISATLVGPPRLVPVR